MGKYTIFFVREKNVDKGYNIGYNSRACDYAKYILKKGDATIANL